MATGEFIEEQIFNWTYTDEQRAKAVRDIEKIIGTGYSDELSATGSGETHLWGGGGADKFNLSNKTFVEDAGKDDKVYMYDIRLSGGVAQWWSDSGWAYWAPVSSLMMPATMGILGGLVLWADVTRALAFRYGFSATGQLIVQTALGLAGQAVIEKYELDLDTGAATGGVVAFQQNLTHGSLSGLIQYLNLALKAGGFGGFMGMDPLVLDLDGDGVELTREDSSKVYFEFDTDGFGERCGWVDAAANDNLPPQYLTRRRAA